MDYDIISRLNVDELKKYLRLRALVEEMKN